MRHQYFIRLTVLTALCAVLATPQPAIGCSCNATTRTAEEEKNYISESLKSSWAVFLGEVVALNKFSVTLKVEAKWKGEIADEITMATGWYDLGNGRVMNSSCDLDDRTVRKKYVVFADRQLAEGDLPERVTASRCGPTRSLPSGQATISILNAVAGKQVTGAP